MPISVTVGTVPHWTDWELVLAPVEPDRPPSEMTSLGTEVMPP